jgi:hypothetical protein
MTLVDALKAENISRLFKLGRQEFVNFLKRCDDSVDMMKIEFKRKGMSNTIFNRFSKCKSSL